LGVTKYGREAEVKGNSEQGGERQRQKGGAKERLNERNGKRVAKSVRRTDGTSYVKRKRGDRLRGRQKKKRGKHGRWE